MLKLMEQILRFLLRYSQKVALQILKAWSICARFATVRGLDPQPCQFSLWEALRYKTYTYVCKPELKELPESDCFKRMTHTR